VSRACTSSSRSASKVTKVDDGEMNKCTKRARLILSVGAVCWERDVEVEVCGASGCSVYFARYSSRRRF
jgi:hypothetical protein